MVGMTEGSTCATEFVGVSNEPGRGIGETGPYEFFTDTGVHVYLHDTDFLGLVWQPEGSMGLYFAYDKDWTPPEARATPVIELVFSHVQMTHWETDREALLETEPVARQVSGFDWDGRDTFDLATFSVNLSFSARHMRVRLAPSAPEILTPPSKSS
jgi:hypothetical protein